MLHGSLVLIFIWLVVGGLGVPLPEDAAVIATGVLVHHQVIELPIAMIVIFVGAIGGDVLLFLLARHLGQSLYQRPICRRLLPPNRRTQIDDAYQRHGGMVVFFGRNIPGLRAAAFVMAGIQGMRLRRFLAYDTLAIFVGIPVVLAVGYFVSEHVTRIRHGLPPRPELALLALALVALVLAALHIARSGTREPATAM